MRDNEWLENRLDHIWQAYFANVSRANEVTIEFGRNARTRLGSIKFTGSRSQCVRPGLEQVVPHSLITITGYFKDERVPEFMIDAVIAHELCHYAHGFSSPHPQLFKCPHLGGAVDHEMIKRNLGDMLIAQRKWLKNEWKNIIGPIRRRRIVRRRRKVSLFKFLMSGY